NSNPKPGNPSHSLRKQEIASSSCVVFEVAAMGTIVETIGGDGRSRARREEEEERERRCLKGEKVRLWRGKGKGRAGYGEVLE
ncbi:hypothetical protein Droror1_Dr00025259, partial [Drosera rotundifolia]